jgi:hypothetical protein
VRTPYPSLLLAAALLCACAPAARPPAHPGASAPDDTHAARYARAIADAAVYSPARVLPLRPAVPDAQGRVHVVTLTDWNYPAGAQALGRDIWVTVVPEVRDSCATFPDGERVMRLRQLLGLRPADAVERFVEMRVPVSGMFRPAVDPSVTTRWPCPEEEATAGQCGLRFPAGVEPRHVAWMANQMLASWQVPAAGADAAPAGRLGYPWTRLGYTYNWASGAPPYGASEYLVRAGTVITVERAWGVDAYCGAG